MSELAAKGIATIGVGQCARDVVVYELTPADMRQMLLNSSWPGEGATPEAYLRYQIDACLFKDCRLTDLAVFTRLEVAELEQLPPSSLRKLLAKAKELNPDFFGALERMASRQSMP